MSKSHANNPILAQDPNQCTDTYPNMALTHPHKERERERDLSGEYPLL